MSHAANSQHSLDRWFKLFSGGSFHWRVLKVDEVLGQKVRGWEKWLTVCRKDLSSTAEFLSFDFLIVYNKTQVSWSLDVSEFIWSLFLSVDLFQFERIKRSYTSMALNRFASHHSNEPSAVLSLAWGEGGCLVPLRGEGVFQKSERSKKNGWKRRVTRHNPIFHGFVMLNKSWNHLGPYNVWKR